MEQVEVCVPDAYNTRKIPHAEFFNDVAVFVTDRGGSSGAIQALEQKLAQYTYMFNNFQSQRDLLRKNIPTLQSSLDSLSYLENKNSEVLFYHEIVNGLYAKAKITDNKKVGLFLGSNIMVEYTIEEAKSLLQKNIADIETQILDLENNLEFLKEQMTVIEVSVSRVFNYDVQLRKQQKDFK